MRIKSRTAVQHPLQRHELYQATHEILQAIVCNGQVTSLRSMVFMGLGVMHVEGVKCPFTMLCQARHHGMMRPHQNLSQN